MESVISLIRPEAQPRSFDNLTVSQINVLKKLINTLLEAVKDIDNIKDVGKGKKEHDSIDKHRASRIFFVSGEAGSGKSTIYLSLWDCLNSGSNSDIEDKLGIKNDLGGRVTWLDPIDLEPISGTTNFLASVLARIDAKVSDDVNKRVPGILELEKDPLKELRRLQNDLAFSWEGNLPERRTHLDPDSYANEVMRAERVRLNIGKRIRSIFHDFCSQKVTKAKSKIFILVIDDFYLQPESSIEILRLLRMISSPYFFTIIIGDFDILEEIFYQKSLGSLVNLAGDHVFQALDEENRNTIKNRARSLASSALRKLIPPAQISMVTEISCNDLENNNDFFHYCYIKEILSKYEIIEKITIKDLIEKSFIKKNDLFDYSGIFHTTPRKILDIFGKIEDIYKNDKKLDSNDKKLDSFVEFAFLQILDSINESDFILKDSLKKIFVFSQNKMIKTEKIRGKKIENDNEGEWALYFLDEEIPVRTQAWIVLLHDILFFSSKNSLTGGSIVLNESGQDSSFYYELPHPKLFKNRDIIDIFDGEIYLLSYI